MRHLTGVAMLACLARPLAAQAGDEGQQRWKFSNLKQGYCISFLVDPEQARDVLPDDAQPMRLDAITDAPPVLARLLKDQPEYGAWMPGAVCIYRFGRADGGGKELVAPANESEMVGVVAYSARVALNQPANGLSASLLFTNDKRIAKATDSTSAAFRQIKATFGKAAHGDDERHVIELGKTRLTWDGHPASDSVALTETLERVWVLDGRRNTPVLMRWTLTAGTSRSMVGVLVVEGKDQLARVMRNSPIRYVGPIYQDGIAELRQVPD